MALHMFQLINWRKFFSRYLSLMKIIPLILFMLTSPSCGSGASPTTGSSAPPTAISAYTYTAASCSSADIQAAINATVDGDTVIIPPCGSVASPTAAQGITIPNDKTLTIQGSGTDQTYLIDGGSNAIFYIRPSATGKVVTIKNIYFQQKSQNAIEVRDAASACNASGCWNSFRITGNTFYHTSLMVSARASGVIDNNLFQYTSSYSTIGVNYGAYNDGGWTEWIDTNQIGTNKSVYVENNTFDMTNFAGGSGAADGNGGSRTVFRFNYTKNLTPGAHDAEVVSGMGNRTYEAYNNRMEFTPSVGSGWVGHRGGSGVWFNNEITSASTFWGADNKPFQFQAKRSANGSTTCGSNPTECWPYLNAPTCAYSSGAKFCAKYAGLGDCSSNAGICTVSGHDFGPCIDIDGHSDNYGWICRNQLGSGQANATTGVQVQEPVYFWNNKSCTGSSTCAVNTEITSPIKGDGSANVLHSDRDYYISMSGGVQVSNSSPFDGTSGVGYGTLVNRPSTCTAGTGYWDAGAHKLYKCTATNTWTEYYTPYTCPHPLAATGSCDFSKAGTVGYVVTGAAPTP
jgi:hypothetical protein